jgi:hypothetical protein
MLCGPRGEKLIAVRGAACGYTECEVVTGLGHLGFTSVRQNRRAGPEIRNGAGRGARRH